MLRRHGRRRRGAGCPFVAVKEALGRQLLSRPRGHVTMTAQLKLGDTEVARVGLETPLEQSLAVMDRYRGGGKIRHVGVSEVSIEQIERARQVVPIAAVQNHYNLSERKHEDVVDYCADQEIPFI